MKAATNKAKCLTPMSSDGVKNDLFCQRIRAFMAEYGITMKKLSELLNVSAVTVSKYVSGKAWAPAPIVINMARLFDTTSDYLYGLTDVKEAVEIEVKEEMEPLPKLVGAHERIIWKALGINRENAIALAAEVSTLVIVAKKNLHIAGMSNLYCKDLLANGYMTGEDYGDYWYWHITDEGLKWLFERTGITVVFR